nr:hypothetical protein Iba_chr09fCG8740 [Ipomoea batatas]
METPKLRQIDTCLLASPHILDITTETNLPKPLSQETIPQAQTDQATTFLLKQSIAELNKAIEMLVRRMNIDMKILEDLTLRQSAEESSLKFSFKIINFLKN